MAALMAMIRQSAGAAQPGSRPGLAAAARPGTNPKEGEPGPSRRAGGFRGEFEFALALRDIPAPWLYIPLGCLLCPKLRLANRTLVSIWLVYYPEYADEVGSPTETRPYSWR